MLYFSSKELRLRYSEMKKDITAYIPIHIHRLRSEPTHLNSAAPVAEAATTMATTTAAAPAPASAVKSQTIFLQRPNARGMPNTRAYKHRIACVCYEMWCMTFSVSLLCSFSLSQFAAQIRMQRISQTLDARRCEWEVSRFGCSRFSTITTAAAAVSSSSYCFCLIFCMEN